MKKTEMIRDMKEDVGRPYMTINQIAKHYGKSKEWAKKIVEGLQYLPAEERGKRYSVHDIAEKVMEEVRVS